MQNVLSIFLELPLLTRIVNFDRWLFRKINSDWTNPFLDNVFPLWREAITWAPLYLFILILVITNFGSKIWPWILFAVITLVLTDQVSSHVLKPLLHRPRPCHDPLLANHLRLLLNNCSGSFSFTSSHATNHFGFAFFIYYTLRSYFGKWSYLFFFWAATISYGQVYIGIHYPIDVAGGALLGTGIGCFTAFVFNKKFGLPPLLFQTNPPVRS